MLGKTSRERTERADQREYRRNVGGFGGGGGVGRGPLRGKREHVSKSQ